MNNHIGDANKMVVTASAQHAAVLRDLLSDDYAGDGDGSPAFTLERAALAAAIAALASTTAAPGIDPADPWRGLYAPELMPQLDGANDWHAVHPDLPQWPNPEDEERALDPLVKAQGFAFAVVDGDYGDDDCNPGEFDTCAWLANWKPEPPEGEHWRLVMVHDTEDGPAAVYVRPLALNDASPKSGSADVRDAARYRWLRDEAISFPYDVEIASPWCVFGMNNAGTEIYPIVGAKLDAAIDAARQFAEDNQPQPTSHGARVPR